MPFKNCICRFLAGKFEYQNVQLIVTILARKLTLFKRNVQTIFAPKKNQKNQKNSLCQKIKKKILKN